jgi:hypothetical protein
MPAIPTQRISFMFTRSDQRGIYKNVSFARQLWWAISIGQDGLQHESSDPASRLFSNA